MPRTRAALLLALALSVTACSATPPPVDGDVPGPDTAKGPTTGVDPLTPSAATAPSGPVAGTDEGLASVAPDSALDEREARGTLDPGMDPAESQVTELAPSTSPTGDGGQDGEKAADEVDESDIDSNGGEPGIEWLEAEAIEDLLAEIDELLEQVGADIDGLDGDIESAADGMNHDEGDI